MQQSTLQFLEELLRKQSPEVYLTRHEKLKGSALKKGVTAEWVEEVYQKLGGQANWREISFALPQGLETPKLRISLDDVLDFNRYRALSLQSGLYQQYQPGWLESYRRYCRSEERECLKAGSRVGEWSFPEAEKHFGKAREAGDFSGPGASGWKFRAFSNFMADVYLLNERQQQEFKRISLFDRMMVQGRLIPLQQLLISRSEPNQLYLQKYLSRQLAISPQQEDKA